MGGRTTLSSLLQWEGQINLCPPKVQLILDYLRFTKLQQSPFLTTKPTQTRKCNRDSISLLQSPGVGFQIKPITTRLCRRGHTSAHPPYTIQDHPPILTCTLVARALHLIPFSHWSSSIEHSQHEHMQWPAGHSKKCVSRNDSLVKILTAKNNMANNMLFRTKNKQSLIQQNNTFYIIRCNIITEFIFYIILYIYTLNY